MDSLVQGVLCRRWCIFGQPCTVFRVSSSEPFRRPNRRESEAAFTRTGRLRIWREQSGYYNCRYEHAVRLCKLTERGLRGQDQLAAKTEFSTMGPSPGQSNRTATNACHPTKPGSSTSCWPFRRRNPLSGVRPIGTDSGVTGDGCGHLLGRYRLGCRSSRRVTDPPRVDHWSDVTVERRGIGNSPRAIPCSEQHR